MRLKHFTIAGLFILVPMLYIHSSKLSQSQGDERENVSGNNDFTEREKRDIKIPTAGLFGETDNITIDFSKLKRNEWCYPLHNGHVISPYGGKRRHSGMDIKTHAGDTVYAAFSGRVRFARPYSGYGNVIVLRHDMGLETVYSHNKYNLVRIGDVVKAGDAIAIVGRTGRATTEHCHFEVRINGKAFNPARFFDPITCCLRSEKVVAYKSGRIETTNIVPANNVAEDKGKQTKSQEARS